MAKREPKLKVNGGENTQTYTHMLQKWRAIQPLKHFATFSSADQILEINSVCVIFRFFNVWRNLPFLGQVADMWPLKYRH